VHEIATAVTFWFEGNTWKKRETKPSQTKRYSVQFNAIGAEKYKKKNKCRFLLERTWTQNVATHSHDSVFSACDEERGLCTAYLSSAKFISKVIYGWHWHNLSSRSPGFNSSWLHVGSEVDDWHWSMLLYEFLQYSLANHHTSIVPYSSVTELTITLTRQYIVARRLVARQRPRNKQLFNSRYWITASQKQSCLHGNNWKQLQRSVFSVQSVPRCYKQDS
jgi:hypothetical protein